MSFKSPFQPKAFYDSIIILVRPHHHWAVRFRNCGVAFFAHKLATFHCFELFAGKVSLTQKKKKKQKTPPNQKTPKKPNTQNTTPSPKYHQEFLGNQTMFQNTRETLHHIHWLLDNLNLYYRYNSFQPLYSFTAHITTILSEGNYILKWTASKRHHVVVLVWLEEKQVRKLHKDTVIFTTSSLTAASSS